MSGIVAAAALVLVASASAPAEPAPTISAPAIPAPQASASPPSLPAGQDEHPDHGAIVVSATQGTKASDPLQSVNAASFAVTQDVDRALVGPVALAYKHTVPAPIRSGLRNALRNIGEPAIAINFMLQIKPGKAAETVGRFVVNSTIGIAGLFDIAKRKPINLPRRANGFAYTMGYYGIKPGPFLFVPLIGPTTLRDALGGAMDRLVVPLAVGAPFNQPVYSVPTGLFSTLDRRAEIDEQIHALRDDNGDPYAAFRKFYLDRRQAEIDNLRGIHRPAPAPAPTPMVDPVATPPAAPTR